MNKLQREIELNKAQVINTEAEKEKSKELIEGLLETVSGRWVNAFANWTKSL